jgi:DNA mismatch repair protein MutS
MALVKEYFELTEKYKNDYNDNTVVLMMVGSFFEVYGYLNKSTQEIYGSSILDFSRICELNVVEKNICVGSTGDVVVMAGFKDFMIEKYVKKLQDAGFTSVVYTQKVLDTGSITRECTAIFSPGTYFQTETTNLNNNISCVWIHSIKPNFLYKTKQLVVGIANINIFTGETSIFQYREPFIMNPTTFDEMERFISIYNPSEAIVISNLTTDEMDTIIGYGNFNCKTMHKICSSDSSPIVTDFTKLAKNCEKQIYQSEILRKFYVSKWTEFDVFLQNFYNNEIATQAFCFLLDFVYRHNPNLVNKVKEPVFENCSDRLVLANHTLKQLNIIDSSGYHDYSGKFSSVCKMLNECLTPMGKRLFEHRLLNPTTKIAYLQKEYDITEYLLNNLAIFETPLKQSLTQIKDLSKWSRQIVLGKIAVKSFCYIKRSLGFTKHIFQVFKTDAAFQSYFKDSFSLAPLETTCDTILSCIDRHLIEEVAIEIDSSFEVNFFKTGVNRELDEKTAELKDAEDQLEAIRFHLNSYIPDKSTRSAANDLIKIHETEKNVFNLLATSRRCKMLEDALPAEKRTVRIDYRSNNEPRSVNIVLGKNVFEYVKQGASNSFIQNNVIGMLCRKITELKQEMKSLVLSAFTHFVTYFNSDGLHDISDFISLVDVLYTRGMLAKKYHYCKPVISNTAETKSFVSFQGIRHCLIEHLQQNELYVTNDLSLGFKDSIDGVLLYGTNAVGKTSFIRSIGICIIMAQAGLFVPCSSFVYKPYKFIFSRIIGNDNLFKGLSTFAVEMSELRTILRLADENSLVLGDELCSGTENTSAISIFVAGIQHLCRRSCSFIFATHLHEIVHYDEILSLTSTIALKHMAVSYNKELDKLVYDRKLKDGPGDSMYGLEVCKSLSLPEDFLESAYQIRLKYHPESQGALSKKTSHYNAKKIMGMCEKCGIRLGSEVHHIHPQALADKDGIIRLEDGSVFHKNNVANLMTVCEKCHNEFHHAK